MHIFFTTYVDHNNSLVSITNTSVGYDIYNKLNFDHVMYNVLPSRLP